MENRTGGAVTLSILDRLIDLDPQAKREAPGSRSTSLREMKAAVRRDLEWLLNSRSHISVEDLTLDEAKNSVAVYGLPDITGMAASNPDEQNRLAAALEHAIRVFEPRFLNPKITMEPPTSFQRALKFRIEALLDVDPAPEPVVFDTVLQLGSADFVVDQKN